MADLEFYSTSAQVLPVMLLVLLLERRALPTNQPWLDLVVAIVGFVAIALGELASLKALSEGRASEDLHSVVVLGLGLGFCAFATLLAGGAIYEVTGRSERGVGLWILTFASLALGSFWVLSL